MHICWDLDAGPLHGMLLFTPSWLISGDVQNYIFKIIVVSLIDLKRKVKSKRKILASFTFLKLCAFFFCGILIEKRFFQGSPDLIESVSLH